MSDNVLTDQQTRELDDIWKSDEHVNKIATNWSLFEKWCDMLSGDRAVAVKKMLEVFGERASLTPASSRFEFHNAFPGGLIDHSLRVASLTIDMAHALKVKVSKESLIVASLFHDWGKVGNDDEDLYLPQTSLWHKARGQPYIFNDKIKMPNAQLSVFLLGKYGIQLTEEEYLAILLNDGPGVAENQKYSMKEPMLAVLVQYADRWASRLEKNRMSLLSPVNVAF